MTRQLLILGASTRAAAFSALRAGFLPRCGDLFADSDLVARCPAEAVDDYPSGLAAMAGGPQPGSWIYCGALENHPQLVDQISAQRPLWGNGGDVLKAVRNPRALAAAAQAAGLRAPALAASPEKLPTDGSWLRKPWHSAGGARVQRWTGQPPATESGQWFFQQEVTGRPQASLFVMARGRSRLLGTTEQLVGLPWCGANAYRYCGSLGPTITDAPITESLERLGAELSHKFELVGLVGIDWVNHEGQVWPLEVNPRYTASVEVLERATGESLLIWHAKACRDGHLPRSPLPDPLRQCGKAVLYAREPLLFPAAMSQQAAQLSSGWFGPDGSEHRRPSGSRGEPHWALADVPPDDSRIDPGAPILSVLAEADTREEVLAALERHAMAVYRQLPTAPPAEGAATTATA